MCQDGVKLTGDTRNFFIISSSTAWNTDTEKTGSYSLEKSQPNCPVVVVVCPIWGAAFMSRANYEAVSLHPVNFKQLQNTPQGQPIYC